MQWSDKKLRNFTDQRGNNSNQSKMVLSMMIICHDKPSNRL